MNVSTVSEVRHRLRSRRRIRGIAVGLLFILTSGLLGFWIYELVYRPRLTPFVQATVTDYSSPLSPMAWAGEDANRLGTLDRESIQLLDASPDWRSRELALKRLDQDLEKLANSRLMTGTVVFYFSLHGRVDSGGRPYLVPADASPFESETWLPVDEVLDHIADGLPTKVHKLVLLDSNRTLSHWETGELHNTFAARLATAVDPQRHPNTVIINSTSPDQVAWSSPSIGGSLFGYYLARGLAGEADRPLVDPSANSNSAHSNSASSNTTRARKDSSIRVVNEDHRVSVNELTSYLNEQLANWCQHHSLPVQSVHQVPATADDFPVVWSLNEGSFERLEERLQINTDPPIGSSQLDSVWQRIGALPKERILAIAPEVFAEVQKSALRLEELSRSGSAYDIASRRGIVMLERRLTEIETQFKDSSGAASQVVVRRKLLNHSLPILSEMPVPSLPLATSLGSVSGHVGQAGKKAWERLVVSPNTDTLESVIDQLQTMHHDDVTEGVTLDNHQFLLLLKRYHTLTRWNRRSVLSDTLRLRAWGDEMAAARLPSGRQDVRAAPWIQNLLNEADQRQWKTEDLLIAGETAAGSRVDPAISQTENAYQDVQNQLTKVTDALALRDDAMYRLPFIAQAFANLPRAKTANDDWMISLLIPAIRQASTLSRQLDGGPRDPQQPGATSADSSLAGFPFLEVADRLRVTLQQIDSKLEQTTLDLTEDVDVSKVSLIDLETMLRLPTLPWLKRRELRRIRDAVVARSTTDDNQTNSVSARLPSLDRVLSWPVHPAVLVVGNQRSFDAQPPTANNSEHSETNTPTEIVAPPENSTQRVEVMGYQVRSALSQWTDEADPTLSMVDQNAPQEWRTAALSQRRTLAWNAGSPAPSPLEKVWRTDWQRLVLWQADRQLNAFMGSPQRSSPHGPATAFFDSACDTCVSVVEQIGHPDTSLQRHIANVRRRQIQRRLAGRLGLETQADHSPLPQGDKGASIRVNVTRSPQNTLPKATASVWIQTIKGRSISSIGTIDTSQSDRQSIELKLSSLAGANRTKAAQTDSPRLTAMTTIRGNEFPQAFVANRLGGTTVRYQPHQYGDATVTLLGKRQRRASVMFVLDCSRSMKDPLAAESINDEAPSRHSQAKNALMEMLDELSLQKSTRAGVIFFGHRVAWTRSDTPSRSQAPGTDASDSLLPSQDVETVLPLGRLDPGSVFSRLDQTSAWGQSPLNLALVEALKAFKTDDPDTQKSIIVITDGRDYQYTPSRSDLRKPRKTTVQDVIRAARGTDIPIHLLGFGLDGPERETAKAEFQKIADATGGQTTTVDYSSELLRRLRESLTLGSFAIQESTSAQAGELPSPTGTKSVVASLNGTVTVPPPKENDESFELVFEAISETIPIAGGEAYQIKLSNDGKRFLPIPFDRMFPERVHLVTGGNNARTPYLMRAHRPERRGRSVVFPVSIQSTRDPVTARPTESYLTITPMRQGVEDRGHRYWFYDGNFEPAQPVPLIHCEAIDWPSDADSASLQFFCKFQNTAPFETIRLRDVLDHPKNFIGRPIDAFPGVQLQVSVSDRVAGSSEYLVNVIQQHSSVTSDLGKIKIEFKTASQYVPTRVTHQFDSANGIVSHTFAFATSDAGGIERSEQSRIVLTSSDALQAGSLNPAGSQPIEVGIYGAADVITLRPAQ